MSDKHFPPNALVELKAGPDDLYQNATAGSRGFVKQSREDEHGFDMIYVEWDKTDWRYNGQPDGWLFESHFDIVPEDDSFGEPNIDTFVKPGPSGDIMRKAMERAETEEVPDDMEKHIEAMDQAVSVLSESDSFLLICTKKIESEEHGTIIAPAVVNGSLDQDTSLALEAQIGQIAGAIAQENAMMLMALLKRVQGEEDEPGQ